MTTATEIECAECGVEIDGDDGQHCGACLIEVWRDYCEECGAEPGDKCVEGCANEHKGESNE
jgi:hypothetical protein